MTPPTESSSSRVIPANDPKVLPADEPAGTDGQQGDVEEPQRPSSVTDAHQLAHAPYLSAISGFSLLL
jgi:hypothetical protein